MKTKYLNYCVILGLLFMWMPPCHADRASRTLSQKVKQADAIVVGTVAEIVAKRFALTVFQIDSDQPFRTHTFDLAALHLTKILKSDDKHLANKADGKKPNARLHVAFQPPGGGPVGMDYSWARSLGKGDTRIWFLQRDLILTGHYFIEDLEDVTEDKVKEIERLIEGERLDHVAIVR